MGTRVSRYDTVYERRVRCRGREAQLGTCRQQSVPDFCVTAVCFPKTEGAFAAISNGWPPFQPGRAPSEVTVMKSLPPCLSSSALLESDKMRSVHSPAVHANVRGRSAASCHGLVLAVKNLLVGAFQESRSSID